MCKNDYFLSKLFEIIKRVCYNIRLILAIIASRFKIQIPATIIIIITIPINTFNMNTPRHFLYRKPANLLLRIPRIR